MEQTKEQLMEEALEDRTPVSNNWPPPSYVKWCVVQGKLYVRDLLIENQYWYEIPEGFFDRLKKMVHEAGDLRRKARRTTSAAQHRRCTDGAVHHLTRR
jgi:hypothetical protein